MLENVEEEEISEELIVVFRLGFGEYQSSSRKRSLNNIEAP
ncbi:hypothetical protein JMUB7504_27550 [Staphylococcus aureus]